MTIIESIWLYFKATFLSSYGSISILFFVLLAATTILGEDHKLSPVLKRMKESRKPLLVVFVLAYVYANYQSFDDMRMQRDHALEQNGFSQLQPDNLMQVAKSLPTSINGLKPGQIWNDGGTIAIVQP